MAQARCRDPLQDWMFSFALIIVAVGGVTLLSAAENRASPEIAAERERPRSVEILEQDLAKQQEVVRRLRGETNALARRIEDADIKALLNVQQQQSEARTEIATLSAVIKYLTNQPKSELPYAITIQGLDFQLSELRQQHANAEEKLAHQLAELGPEHPEVKRLARVVGQMRRRVDDRVEDFMRGLEPRLASAKAVKARADKAWTEAKPLYDEYVRCAIRRRDAVKRLRTEEDLLRRLRLRLADELARQK